MRVRKSNALVLLVALSLGSSSDGAKVAPPQPPTGLQDVVQTRQGTVSGYEDASGLHVYKGIPFAAPPVGDLRWRAPEPAKPWKGVRQAVEFGPDCMQRPDPRLRAKTMSEDCLYLNVWSPAERTDEKLPVMVFLYGGAFDHGSGSRVDFDGKDLARRGVVFVNFNYRLALFGFLAHPLLTAESPHHSSGDYAILDQIAALRWIQDNIAAFGGDPSHVMIFGQSAGGSSVNLMLISPLAKGLFQAAASESPGEMRALGTVSDAEKFGVTLGNNLAAMRAIPALELVDKEADFKRMRSPEATSPRPLWPVIDGWALPRSERDAYASGHVNIVPLIIGNNAAESGDGSHSAPMTVEQYRSHVEAMYGKSAPEILRIFPVHADGDAPAVLASLSAANEFGFAVRADAVDMSSINPSTYRYLFTRHRNDGPAPPVHADELTYVFGNLYIKPRSAPAAYDAVDQKLSDTMMSYWIQLARTGNPNTHGLPSWPAFNASSNLVLDLGKDIHAKPDEHEAQFDGIRKAYETNPVTQPQT